MNYQVYYGDGRVLSDSAAPLTGDNARSVQVIVQHDQDGPVMLTGADYYIWRSERWVGVDIFGLFDYLLDSGLVLFGRTVTADEYQAIYQRAKLEKRTWRPGERRPIKT